MSGLNQGLDKPHIPKLPTVDDLTSICINASTIWPYALYNGAHGHHVALHRYPWTALWNRNEVHSEEESGQSKYYQGQEIINNTHSAHVLSG